MRPDFEQSPELRFDIEQLVLAANRLADHGEDLAAQHLIADNQLESAASGWIGRSAIALTNRADIWRSQTRTLVGRVGEHANGIHGAAIRFAAMESEHTAALGPPEAVSGS